MFEIGRICVKLAGRDAGMKCVIIDILDHNTALIDGQTRRRKCNLRHLEPLNESVEIKKNASFSEITKALGEIGIELPERKENKKEKSADKPKSTRKTKEKPVKAPVAEKKAKKSSVKEKAETSDKKEE
jgi:large subunit ribosomal protein L14e